MSINRKTYVDQLLSDLDLLKERILLVKESDTLPFSFFSASFDRIEKISRSLHELELMQIREMKAQMEQLVKFLSEQPKHTEPSDDIPQELSSNEPIRIVEVQEKTPLVERIVLPEYKDPRIGETVSSTEEVIQIVVEKSDQDKPVPRSLNDIIQSPPKLLDLKKGISLNDRFLFQRELFNNNRSEMDKVMELLNTLGSIEEVENYLRSECNWNFDNQTVKEFLLIVKKGFA